MKCYVQLCFARTAGFLSAISLTTCRDDVCFLVKETDGVCDVLRCREVV